MILIKSTQCAPDMYCVDQSFSESISNHRIGVVESSLSCQLLIIFLSQIHKTREQTLPPAQTFTDKCFLLVLQLTLSDLQCWS